MPEPISSVPSQRVGEGAPPSVPDHELLRCIGGGSYGEVWLARSRLGTLRAAKIVYRHSFEDRRPFEREFKGIQKFEPISRSHEGLVDILQVGGMADYFYYVMELADDGKSVSGSEFRVPSSGCAQSETPNPKRATAVPDTQSETRNSEVETYLPRTLRHDLKTRGRLLPAECISIGVALTSALEHLHRKGLLHRDIKPSNIIFVGGMPKLADIGLVAEVSEARSYVGTEGFIPPEGPGTPQADLYSLGKVLYEISTGHDRRDFPTLPTEFKDNAEEAAFLELNAVMVKACKTEPRERYESAEEMRAELEQLQRGQSVKRKRVTQRRLAWAIRLSLAAAVIALVAIGASLLSKRFNDSSVQGFNGPIPVDVNSIAVLPFINESENKAYHYLSRALSDEAMNALNHCAGLKVVPRSATFAFKSTTNDLRQVGERLGVRTVLAGSVKRTSNQLSVTARLINVADGAPLWSARNDRYRSSSNLPGIANELLTNVARVLKVSLPETALRQMGTNFTSKLAAYRFYSQAITNVRNTQDGLDRSIRLLHQAIAEDSNCAEAYADLARRYAEGAAFYLPEAQAMGQARVNALRALQLDDSLPLAHCALASVYSGRDLDFAKAQHHYKRAIELDPQEGSTYGDYATMCSLFGAFSEAEQVLKRGEQVAPKDHNLLCGWCWRYYLGRDFEKARQAANRLQSVYSNSIMAPWFLAHAHEGLRQYNEALASAQQVTRIDPAPDTVSLLGRLHARLGHREEAEKALDQIRLLSQSPGGGRAYAAEVMLARRDIDGAIEHLRRVVDDNPHSVLGLKASPLWDDLRSDVRFQALLKRSSVEK